MIIVNYEESQSYDKLLNIHHICLVRNFPTQYGNPPLLELLGRLGKIIAPKSIFLTSKVEDNFVYRVEADPNMQTNIISQTDLEFTYHTDGFNSELVPRIVALLCISPAEIGGLSKFIDIENVVKLISNKLLNKLLQIQCETPSNKQMRILVKDDNGYRIFFNPYEISRIFKRARIVNSFEVAEILKKNHPELYSLF